MSNKSSDGFSTDTLIPIRLGIGVGEVSEISKKLVRLVTSQEEFSAFDRDPVNYLVHHGLTSSNLDAAALIALARHLHERVTGKLKQALQATPTNHDSGTESKFTTAQRRQQQTNQQSKQKNQAAFNWEKEFTLNINREGCNTDINSATMALLAISPDTPGNFPDQPLVSPILIQTIRSRQGISQQ